MRKVIHNIALTLALYAGAGWVYVAVVSIATPRFLPIQLTHLASWPRTDTFGEYCFVISIISFFVYLSTRAPTGPG